MSSAKAIDAMTYRELQARVKAVRKTPGEQRANAKATDLRRFLKKKLGSGGRASRKAAAAASEGVIRFTLSGGSNRKRFRWQGKVITTAEAADLIEENMEGYTYVGKKKADVIILANGVKEPSASAKRRRRKAYIRTSPLCVCVCVCVVYVRTHTHSLSLSL